jgi:molybdopterin synthase catalytic subunit
MRTIEQLIATIKSHPQARQCGMILCHNGIVRGTSRDGRPVNGLKIDVDHDKLAQVRHKYKQLPGIVEILVEIADQERLAVGDDVMFLVVAGDIRENVIAALSGALNEIKASVTHKTQFFVDDAVNSLEP